MLENGIQKLFDSDKYKEYLNTMAKFYNYSYRNTLLILMQNPSASYVAGYTAWKNNFDRQVKRGEKAIKILAPAPYKTTVKRLDTVEKEHEMTVNAFKVTGVFDISQTDGKELPSICEKLNGSYKDYDSFVDVIKSISPVPVSIEKIDSSANGYYSPIDKRIVVKEGLSEQQTLKTMIHEISHALLHNPENVQESNRRTWEVQAESIAYTVCQHFGLDSSDYSFGYIASWSSGKDIKELKASLNTIQNTASEIISKIEQKQKEKQKNSVLAELKNCKTHHISNVEIKTKKYELEV